MVPAISIAFAPPRHPWTRNLAAAVGVSCQHRETFHRPAGSEGDDDTDIHWLTRSHDAP